MDLGKAPEPGTIALIVVVALIGMLMGVFGKPAAEWLLNLILRPVRFVKETVYRWIAPRNPLSISLHSYKKHVSRSNLTRIENPVGPNLEVPLEHAFAPLKLISSATEESVELFSQAASSHRCIVLGGPGTGKTTLMKSLVTSVIQGQAREEALKDLIPVFVVLRNLAKKEHTVEQALVAAFADYHFPGAERFVASALDQGKMLIILDGLDEVGASRDYVAEQIQKFCEYDDQRAARNRLIVTCREHSYRTKDLQGVIPEVVRVEPFANHHMRIFLKGWPVHKGRTAMKLYGLIQNDPQIRDICRNPLLLTILTGLYLDTDNFELPTSRERFYKDAIDELLIQRPVRRHIKQTFDPEEKRQILERVALDRLETVTPHEDPEEFTQEVIRQKAEEVFRKSEFDLRELVKELVEINGIIKPGKEGTFTCAHRTIQEYFAAREARRKRKTEEVVEHFGGRPEFIEVLYFYCGLVDNIPALAYVVTTLIGQERWLEAGRCILHMKEPPDITLVEMIARVLNDKVAPSGQYKPALEVLSSLSQRHAPEFEPARKFFTQAVDHLAKGYGESGASALESALATSPEAAMKVVPGLLKHQSPRWKEAGVQLLRDIGTDEALDQLVQLLSYADPFVKAQAGRTLAEMLKSRPLDLRARTVLLPPRKDATVWPLEDYFPGSLAIPIAEALGDSVETKSEAINCAARALRARNDGEGERSFLKQWRRVPRDLTLHHWRRGVGRGVVLTGYALTLACFFTLFILQVRGYWTNHVLVVTLGPPRIQLMEGQWLDRVQAQAKAVVADIEQRYPPNASGLSRVLPWNWSVEPALPEGKDKAYEALGKWPGADSPNPYKSSDKSPEMLALRGVASDDKMAELEAGLAALKQHLPPVQGARYLFIKPSLALPLVMLIVLAITLFWVSFQSLSELPSAPLRKKSSGKKQPKLRAMFVILLGNFYSEVGFMFNTLAALMIGFGMFLYTVIGLDGSLLFRWAPPILMAVSAGIGAFIQLLRWPNNPLLPAVAEIVSPQKTEKKDKEIDELDLDEWLPALRR